MTGSWFDLGDVAVVPIVETPRLLIAPEEFFPDVPVDRQEWCFREPWFDAATGRLVYVIQSFLVVTPTATVLVDACVGGGKPRLRPEFADLDAGWLAALRATGTSPLDVTSVVLTHLHVDHVGWCTQAHGDDWRPVFRNARHSVTGPELDHWTSRPVPPPCAAPGTTWPTASVRCSRTACSTSSTPTPRSRPASGWSRPPGTPRATSSCGSPGAAVS